MQLPAAAASPTPETDPAKVLAAVIKEYHFHIHFNTNNPDQAAYALKLRDAVLSLRTQGIFVAVPLFRVNNGPMGPHPAGSYEIWVPDSSFASVYSYLTLNRGDLSILIHPLTADEETDHFVRAAWIGPSWPLYKSMLRDGLPGPPLQYPSLKLGYSTKALQPSLEELRRNGAKVEETLKNEPEAAPAPSS